MRAFSFNGKVYLAHKGKVKQAVCKNCKGTGWDKGVKCICQEEA